MLSKVINKYGQNWLVLIMIRNIPVFPLFFQNVVLSIFKISDFKFILTTLIGVFPFILLYSVLGESLASLTDLNNYEIKRGLDNRALIFFISSIVLILILDLEMRKLVKKY